MNIDKKFKLVQLECKKMEEELDKGKILLKTYDEFKTRGYGLLPEVVENIRAIQRIVVVGETPDYSRDLNRLKISFEMWLKEHEDEITESGNYILNDSKLLLSIDNINITEEGLEKLIAESKYYIKKQNYDEKKIGLEKIWDAFERLKTIKGTDKKESIKEIIANISNADDNIAKIIESEFKTLTEIGNNYSIRHSETSQFQLTDSYMIEYLYFRMLSLISFVLGSLK